MKTLIFAVTAALASMAPQASTAMPHCGERDSVIESLTDKFGEHHFASGLQSATGLMEIWASEERGTWTVLMTRPDGQTCVVASGSHWLVQEDITPVGDPV